MDLKWGNMFITQSLNIDVVNMKERKHLKGVVAKYSIEVCWLILKGHDC